VGRLAVAFVGVRGDGVANSVHGPLFLPFTLPDEEVLVEFGVPLPKLLAIERASVDRVAPICRHFGDCGGCRLQHWRHAPYLAWKRGLVLEALRARGIEAPVAATIDAHGTGRRRAIFHARRDAKGVHVGFMRMGSHAIVAIEECPILAAPDMAMALPVAADVAEILTKNNKPLDIAVTATDTGLDVATKGHGPLTRAKRERLVALATRHDLPRLANHNEVIVEQHQPLITIGSCRVAPPPGVFLQPTMQGEAALAALVAEGVGEARNIVDLYCGIGPFALRLAAKAKLSAFDSDAYAIAALLKAARGVPGLKPVRGETRDLFRRPLLPVEINGFDAIVLNPPRQGAQAQMRELARSRAQRVVYVSCNPSTFARDAATLIASGFRLERVTPVDQFRYNLHVEIVGVFIR
jgi:23S rRNA (uracil1939-C5)-methyltransferase